MRKLVPILTLTLCALLLVTLARPATVQAAFPADNDRLDYELRVDSLTKLAAGPPDYDYDIEIDMTHTIQNSSGDLYWANVTTTYIGPSDIFGPWTGNTTWAPMLHHYVADEVPHVHLVTPSDWSNYSPFWFTDIFYIMPGLVPGDSVQIGFSDPVVNNTYGFFGVPVMPGPTFTVGLNQLSTVEIGLSYEMHSNNTLFPSDPFWDMTFDFEIIWEWSLGFLCQINFDFYINLNPYDIFYPTEQFVTGNLTLVDYSLTDSPVAFTGGVAPGAELLPIIIAVIAIIIIVCFVIFFLIWRSRKGK